MHILLTDLLTCPRCGPDHGLIVLSDDLRDRRVRAGSVGCANCRSSFPIEGGTADLRHPTSPGVEAASPLPADPERPLRVAALLGVTMANATVLLLEPELGEAASVAELLPEVHVVAASTADGAGDVEGEPALSRIRTGARLPLRSATLRGVGVLGIDPMRLLPEIRRVLLPGGRAVFEAAPEGLRPALEEHGFVVHLEQDGVVVAGAPERG